MSDGYIWLRYWRERNWDMLAWSGLANIAAIVGLYALWCLMVWLALLGLDFIGAIP